MVMTVIDEGGRTQKEAALVYFKILPSISPERTGETFFQK
jgi:hypothetical protein